MVLAVNIFGALVLVAGVIVTALSLNEPWRTRAIVWVLALGTIYVALIIAVDERASSVIGAAVGATLALFSYSIVQILLAIAFGAVAAWYLRPRIERRKRRSIFDVAEAIRWPNVRTGLPVTQAIDAFVNPELLGTFSSAQAEAKKREQELAEWRAGRPDADLTNITMFTDPEFVNLSKLHDDAKTAVYTAQFEILNDLRDKLQ